MAEVGAVQNGLRDILLKGYQPWLEQRGDKPSIASTIRYLLEVKAGMLAEPLPNPRQQDIAMAAVEELINEQRNNILLAVLKEMGDIVEDLPRG
jgi:hypothetical protein